jgi:hypothetical protein
MRLVLEPMSSGQRITPPFFLRFSSLVAITLTLLTAIAPRLLAGGPDRPPRTLVLIDLTNPDGKLIPAGFTRDWTALPAGSWSGNPSDNELKALDGLFKTFEDPNTHSKASETALIQEVRRFMTERSSTRSLATKDDAIAVYLIADAWDQQDPLLVPKEVRRLTRLSQDLQTVFTAVAKKGLGAAGGVNPTIKVRQSIIRLSERRSTLTLTSRSIRKTEDAREIADTSCNKSECVKRQVVLTTGPAEHIFLSVDLPISKVSDLKYDSKTGTLSPKTTPTVAFLGVNVTPTDLFAADDPCTPAGSGTTASALAKCLFNLERVVFKGFIKLSAKPSDAFGFGVGYRPPKTAVWGLDLDVLQVFGAYVWTTQDAITSAGASVPDAHYQGAWRLGVSFNVDKVTDWLKF